MNTIRNLHGREIRVSANDLLTGQRYLEAERSKRPFIAYVYRAPETGKTYIAHTESVGALGRIIYAIAHKTTVYLEGDEAERYADPEGEELLCDFGRAYSLWCAEYYALEGTRCDVEV